MHSGEANKYKYFELTFFFFANKVIKAPETPANPVPELHPTTYPSGKSLKYPSTVASPNAEPVPIIKLGIRDRIKAEVFPNKWWVWSIKKSKINPKKKYIARNPILFVYGDFKQYFELIIRAQEEKRIRALLLI